MPNRYRAFTLIEILVTIAILAILAIAVFVSLQHPLERDKRFKRIADLRTIQKALAEYAADNGGMYPISAKSGADWNSQCGIASGYAGGNLSPTNVIPGLVPTYLSAMLADPDMQTSQTANGMKGTCCYIYKSDGKDYKVLDFNCPTADYANVEYKTMNMVDPCRPGPYMPSFAIGVWTDGARVCNAPAPANGW